MKKTFSLLVALLMLLTLSVPAFAANGNFAVNGEFVSSPGALPAPGLIEVTNDGEVPYDMGWIKITPYRDRDELTDEGRAEIEQACNELVNAEKLTDLTADFAAVVEKARANVDTLAVVHLFDVTALNYDPAIHGNLTIKLDGRLIVNFVGMLHSEDGVWEVVDGAHINDDGQLVFTIDSLSPFAVVVDTNAFVQEAAPDYSMRFILAGIVVVVGVALGFVAVKNSKKESAVK